MLVPRGGTGGGVKEGQFCTGGGVKEGQFCTGVTLTSHTCIKCSKIYIIGVQTVVHNSDFTMC